MNNADYASWSRIYYLVSDVYRATHRLRSGEQIELGYRIRRSAISLSSAVNSFNLNDDHNIYHVISSVSVLETYLLLAKQHGLLKNDTELNLKISQVKEALNLIVQNKKNPESGL